MNLDDVEGSVLPNAREAIRRSPSDGAMDSLGLWEMLGEFDEPDARAATFSLFRAHGRELGESAALGSLMAHPYVAARGLSRGSITRATPRQSTRRGAAYWVFGDPSIESILIDRPGMGASILAIDQVILEPIDIPGRLRIYEIGFDPNLLEPTIPEGRAAEARGRSLFLGRLAAAFEILGAAEGALDLAVEHAHSREQFGAAIGSFQAVRHLLAWARTDCVAIHHTCRQAAALDRAAPPRFDEVVKALAGRNGRRACERSLQVLGGIGFTADHDHHHFHSRVLALDSVLGTSAELARGLGTWLRETGSDPRIASGLLHRGGTS